MEVSAELRWFWDTVPPNLYDWFVNSPMHPFAAGGKELREDVYLHDPEQVELGVKARGEKPGLEVKGLVGRTGSLSEGAFCGEIEIWTKWTSRALTLPAATIATSKTRWLRKFDTGEGAPREIELNAKGKPVREQLPARGCNVELTMVKIEDVVAWTFGFEAFGELDQVCEQLRAVAASMSAREPPDFGRSSLKSYPAWLAGRPRS
ncbi:MULTISPECIES: hypothetical protein [unclassified Mesorhizobium]|uniref:hypothetical protein n=1 Tax=unclassified Mesorhizobium TaxID=325217 RepID=UPI000FE568B4|nr:MULTISPECIES: hypothetical protein [unclassified Mesorhizobium]RWB93104.1 MAG: hypothetical protein EOQ57_35030 [Mesorhizobium sp.]TGV18294.1 hypothetical protein EN786_33910 [Mesorhizobium sp. M4B.F.Ca.ET.143.01.1.1]TIU23864.1 MAG: hypothetical protein E5W49_02435 [Mesorhizobium sp.]